MTDIDARILGEAADWLVLLQEGDLNATDRERFERWREISAAHEAAWQRAERIRQSFARVPAAIARETLKQLPEGGRRRALRALLGLGIGLPATWIAVRHSPWQRWTADLRTATGETRPVTLTDGTQLLLNTATAVDVMYDDRERRLVLCEGELLIDTAHDASERPFLVDLRHGRLRALGTRFAVRLHDARAQLVVAEGAVEIRPARSGGVTIVAAGEQATFDAHGSAAPEASADDALLWQRHVLLAQNLRLGALVAELDRYHPGRLRCDPAIAELVVSGSFPTDVDRSLALLEKTLPVRVHRLTPFWITLQPR
ncbi:MAG: FecR domain-containing protein [Steroidobacteraceae bacterium]